MGQKRYARSLKQDERRRELAELAKRPRAPSIRQKVAAFNAEILETADLQAIKSWGGARGTVASASSGDADAEGVVDAHCVVVGNLPVDLRPEDVKAALTPLVVEKARDAGVDAAKELVGDIGVGVFGPCRPKTRRDRDREFRGFAVVRFRSASGAAAAATALHGTTFRTKSAKWPERVLNARLDDKGEYDDAYVRGLRGSAPKIPDKVSKKEPRKRWKMAELENLPMRQKCLSTHTRFSDLDGKLRVRLLEYLSTAIPAMPELAGVVLAMEQSAPHYLRIKELIESIECFNVILGHLNSAESTAGRSMDDVRVYDTFFDLACGHGLVGVLLAYAFPTRTVRSFDHTKRAAFFAFCHAFEQMRKTMTRKPWTVGAIDWDTEEMFVASNRLEETNDASTAPKDVRDDEEPALSNIVFTLGDIDDARALVNASSFVVALHGCNEANKVAVEMAKSQDAVWAVMPCCIKASIYLPECIVSKLDDDSKYGFMCGVMCQKYDAQLIRAIDTRITTRAIVLCGGIKGFKKHCFVIGNNTKIQRERERKMEAPLH
ncbi:predicted protein [Ostreococcus lucimarinus CCE9901]|jgi:hypothetical protein|uniref:RRM domain-containing protein n=1 Tax=Ostreococcus lucimarinus (strain CCE9901) TaxID=436017 RepID=A4S3Q4_OSTLU|nr:predicted protein [Ostreococcus lucimarinus CCE9901]ABO98254.1 predicted protein [Ostreococcus lucimarinus CCE9901]|tara:strand:- start:4723 stop:6366 length:1644 start_codon:yes stop_codon:yes gene_type:complete|eukprot:XP_001419961.1 predicted protein [Ostreococcus lucimarinus CCE9901]